jgi:fatty-acyl-CoA synthase
MARASGRISANWAVAPTQVEASLATHPAPDDGAGVGRPHDKTGQFRIAPRRSAAATRGARADGLGRGVASYEHIRAVGFVDQIPRSLAGRILRRLLGPTQCRSNQAFSS